MLITLPERIDSEELFLMLKDMLASKGKSFLANYLYFIVFFFRELGYPLDLYHCAVTGKTSDLIGLECSERYFENAVAGRGNLRRPQFYFYVLSSCLAFHLLFALLVLFSEFLQLLLRQLLRNGITKLLNLPKPLADNLLVLRIHIAQRITENFADQIPHVPLVVSRHYIPRGFFPFAGTCFTILQRKS